jgi:hypothetical protein
VSARPKRISWAPLLETAWNVSSGSYVDRELHVSSLKRHSYTASCILTSDDLYSENCLVDSWADLDHIFFGSASAPDAIADLVHDGVVEEYPQSGERIRGKDNARTVYENYPSIPT